MNKIKNFFLKKSIQTTIASLVVFFAIWIVYINSLGNEFLWDDEAGIVFNKYIQNWTYFLNFFSENLYAGEGTLSYYWRPAVLSVFAVEWHTFLMWPGGYHMVNILLHGINALLIFYLFRLLFDRFFIAFLAALVFGIHPLNTEAITYISGIADPLCALFVLLGVIAYLRSEREAKPHRKRMIFFVVFLSFFLALLSKESAVMMPGLLFLADIFNKRNEIKTWRDLKNPLKNIAPFLLVDALYVVSRLSVLNFIKDSPPSPLDLPFFERIFTFFHSFLLYFRLMFAPLHLHMEWMLPGEKTLISLPVITGCLIFSFLLFLILKTFKKNPEISFGLAWFLVALSPNMNIFMPATALLAEHWLYLSLPGFFFALFVLFETISSTWRYRPILLVFLISWIVWIGNHTILRNRDWADSITLFSRTLQESPKSYRANVSLGSVYQKEKQYDKALGYFTRAIAIEPKNPLSYHLRALLYTKMGKNEEALRDHERSVFLDPKNSTSIVFLLKEYSERNENAKIRDILEQQLKNTTDPMAAEKILLSLIHLANAEKNKDLAKKYTELFTKEEMILQNDPMTKIGNFLNKHL